MNVIVPSGLIGANRNIKLPTITSGGVHLYLRIYNLSTSYTITPTPPSNTPLGIDIIGSPTAAPAAVVVGSSVFERDSVYHFMSLTTSKWLLVSENVGLGG